MNKISKSGIMRILLEIICMILLVCGLCASELYIQPHARGFFCNDETIMYPYINKATISTSNLIIMPFIFFFLITIGEVIYARKIRKSSLELLNSNIPNWLTLIYQKGGYFVIGAITTVLIGDVTKLTIGRLRPHFMDLCKPDIDCSLPINHNKYFNSDEFNCTANITASVLKEARLSFPSGHASLSTYCAVFFIFYLQLRITCKSLKLFKYLLQFILVLIVTFVSMTRIADFWHHWSDVTVGILIGLINALVTVFLVADLLKERKTSNVNNDQKINDSNSNGQINILVKNEKLII
ncbi:putative phosphatidate phosphatase [Microplitis demolitor]|uniref:putative phosphatidate phosphatase n=1 Tax=Microplitis demolitor TaxID=69319 RepID=UPI0004CD02AC|nr:putative phosphatidate phosphatase [Microplitis demolitor]